MAPDDPATALAADLRAWPGRPFPLGATWDGAGTNVAVWSSSATAVSVCLFDANGVQSVVPLPECTDRIWHGYLPGIGPGQRYGLRVDGPRDPSRGLLHNPAKLLVDPYARALDGAFLDHPAVYGDNAADSAPYVPRSVVVHAEFPWGADRSPDISWGDTVLYELHVRGFTRTHPGIPPELRGTYAGLGHPAAVEYLRSLGVTAVELLPVHHFVTEPALQRRGAANYWGYNSLGFFAPHAAYAATPGGEVAEFQAMVRSLHAAGIEVILDVVYNHTAEGQPGGPVLGFKGIDNAGYYRLAEDDASRYLDYTGCGNTVDARLPFPLRLVLDSLRYWVSEMHVDGFRFDLASALSRPRPVYGPVPTLFDVIDQDPVISRAKLIAEPWDLGPDGYQLGRFPAPWSEWNGRYRDTVRSFWSTDPGGVRDLAYRLTGSSDLYAATGRRPFASINFITSHDGFTMRDLVSYERKHNEPNGEGNRDGTDDNRSANGGVEGETADPAVEALRLRQVRNLMTTLALSTGVPMIVAGDERWRTQGGNNNAYVQDNEVSWLDWSPSSGADDITELTRRVLALRRMSPVLRQGNFLQGRLVPGADGCKDVAWFHPDGRELIDGDWFDTGLRTIGMYLDGRGLRGRGPRDELVIDHSYLLVLHSGDDPVMCTLPGAPWADFYEAVVDTHNVGGRPAPGVVSGGATAVLQPRSTLLLRAGRGG